MKKSVFIILFFSISLFANTINIAVASNVIYAIDELKKEFNKEYPHINLRVTLGSSGKLTAQIKNGAPYMLFMSANMKYPNSLYKDGLAITKPIVYAQGSLSYFSVNSYDFSNGMNLLKNSKISKIAVANPKSAPYGIAAFEAMKNGGVFDDVKSKFVYGESVSQTISYAMIATDIGLVAKSALYSPRMKKYKKNINWEDVNLSLYKPINQGIVILKDSKDVRSFYDFILSEKAKKIFLNFGYLVP